MTETSDVTFTTDCDCGGPCSLEPVDCCDTPQPACQIATILDANGDPDVVVCRRGLGCDERGAPW